MLQRQTLPVAGDSTNVCGSSDGRWRVQLVVDGQRPPETLRLQMQKIYDCESVEITAVDSGEAA